MKCLMSWTDALTFHHDLPFIPFHRTYAPFTSSPQFISLHFIFGWFYQHLHFALFITFLTLFLNLLDLEERVPKASADSWFQRWIVLFTKEYPPTYVYIFLVISFFLSFAPKSYTHSSSPPCVLCDLFVSSSLIWWGEKVTKLLKPKYSSEPGRLGQGSRNGHMPLMSRRRSVVCAV
jgi:hypothetical protein